MKNIQAQYQDLLEGKMSKSNFMRNVRMQFPQHISPVNSFDDSVKILKGKRILSEAKIEDVSEDLKIVKEPNPNAGKYRIMSVDGKRVIAKDFFDSMEAAQKYARENIRTSSKIVKLPAERGVYRKVENLQEAYKDFSNNELASHIGTLKNELNAEKDPKKAKMLEKDLEDVKAELESRKEAKKEGLNEDKKPIGVYGHNPNAENDLYRGIDHVNYYQAYKGIQFELAKEKEITDEAFVRVREKVVKNILKDPDAYKNLQLANFAAVKKMDKDLEMKAVKSDNHVDKANEMKVVKKDAPASANTDKKSAKKKEKVAQMTQAPKSQKGVETFETPGKEKVMALREHILDELTKPNEMREDINKGSRVKKKGLKDYDAAQVGNVIEFDGDTAIIIWDKDSDAYEKAKAEWNRSGEGEDPDETFGHHVQANVLTKRDIPQHPKAAEKFGALPNVANVVGADTGVPAKATQMQDTVKEGGDSDLDMIAQAEFGMDYDQLGSGEQEWCRDERDNKVEESKDVEQSDMKSKLKNIKERLIKALKKEEIRKNPKTGEAVSTMTAADNAMARKMGYTTEVPSTIKPLGKIQ